jgi:hypothetical protein
MPSYGSASSHYPGGGAGYMPGGNASSPPKSNKPTQSTSPPPQDPPPQDPPPQDPPPQDPPPQDFPGDDTTGTGPADTGPADTGPAPALFSISAFDDFVSLDGDKDDGGAVSLKADAGDNELVDAWAGPTDNGIGGGLEVLNKTIDFGNDRNDGDGAGAGNGDAGHGGSPFGLGGLTDGVGNLLDGGDGDGGTGDDAGDDDGGLLCLDGVTDSLDGILGHNDDGDTDTGNDTGNGNSDGDGAPFGLGSIANGLDGILPNSDGGDDNPLLDVNTDDGLEVLVDAGDLLDARVAVLDEDSLVEANVDGIVNADVDIGSDMSLPGALSLGDAGNLCSVDLDVPGEMPDVSNIADGLGGNDVVPSNPLGGLGGILDDLTGCGE